MLGLESGLTKRMMGLLELKAPRLAARPKPCPPPST
jgi:hypothetical protein